MNNFDQQQQASLNESKVSKSPASVQAKTSITVNTFRAGSNIEVVRGCIKELDWQECPNGLNNTNCDIIWQSTNNSNEQDQNYQTNTCPTVTKINKFPGVYFFNLLMFNNIILIL